MRRLACLLITIASCSRPGPEPRRDLPRTPFRDASVAEAASTAPDADLPDTGAEAEAGRAQLDPDGNDDPEETGTGAFPSQGRFERVGKSPYSLFHICDLTPFGDSLYSAHAIQPLGLDGAVIVRYRPEDAKPFSVAFDWNRPGEPVTGGGGGQGFLRVHSIGGRLFVPDADPPYNGFGISEPGTEGFVFVSDREGKFAAATRPGHRPPKPPDAEGRAGAGVIPRAYHVLDVIRYRGRYYASTGSVPPKQAAWSGPSPGALHVASGDLSRWTYEIDYPFPWKKDGVWRLTYLVRFRDRLYAGIQDYDGREPNDYVYFDPPAEATVIEREHVHPVRVTDSGTAQTYRWYAAKGKLYWIAATANGVELRVTADGDKWTEIDLPAEVGRPTDITTFRGELVVLAERGLLKLGDSGPVVVVQIAEKKSPFALKDWFCAAPLAVFRNELYAGGQHDGALYRLVE